LPEPGGKESCQLGTNPVPVGGIGKTEVGRFSWLAGPDRAPSDSARVLTLIIAGDEENVERHTRIFRGIAYAKLCILPGTDHATFPSRPDWLNPIILEFLDFNALSRGPWAVLAMRAV
jgi:pimeloyl-ACP methyl ester carboxylesterase